MLTRDGGMDTFRAGFLSFFVFFPSSWKESDSKAGRNDGTTSNLRRKRHNNIGKTFCCTVSPPWPRGILVVSEWGKSSTGAPQWWTKMKKKSTKCWFKVQIVEGSQQSCARNTLVFSRLIHNQVNFTCKLKKLDSLRTRWLTTDDSTPSARMPSVRVWGSKPAGALRALPHKRWSLSIFSVHLIDVQMSVWSCSSPLSSSIFY